MLNRSNRNNADSLFDLGNNSLVSIKETTKHYSRFAGFVLKNNATDVDLGDLYEDYDQDFDEESNTDMREALDYVANMVTERDTENNSQIPDLE
ncbi:hypothetical protein G6F56_002845 [Rhizopus delemar]|nr:hypothetical protein G6F56_002845 [Rhizopus delemar]